MFQIVKLELAMFEMSSVATAFRLEDMLCIPSGVLRSRVSSSAGFIGS